MDAGDCVDACVRAGTWTDPNGGNPQCSACTTGCNVCDNNDTCTTCNSAGGYLTGGYFKTSTNTCVTTCVENSGAQFGNAGTGLC